MNGLSQIWHSKKQRGVLFQILLLLFISALSYIIISNTITNLQVRGIASGFSFLSQEAGFDVSFSLIDYLPENSIWRVYVVGLLNTILVSSLGVIIATILGFLIGIARLSKNWLLAKTSLAYIETLRNIPLLLQIFFWYFAVLQALPGARNSLSIGDTVFLNLRGLYLPKPDSLTLMIFVISVVVAFMAMSWISRMATARMNKHGKDTPTLLLYVLAIIGIPTLGYLLMGKVPSFDYAKLEGFNFQGGWVIIPELFALLIALATYTAAFIAEVVRAGIMAVPKGQIEAADALGLSRGQVIRLVVIPQALRVIIPPLTNQYLNLTKNSTLAAAIGYPDLVLLFSGIVLGQVGQAVEVVGMMMLTYLTISLLISLVMNWYNAKTAFVSK